MELSYYTADVFTKERFQGAQIAVFPKADQLDPATMQKIAAEMNLSETVFISSMEAKENGKQYRKRMRVFSPKEELNFAGHPIIAAAYVLSESGEVPVQQNHTLVVLEQNIGPINTYLSHSEDGSKFIQFSLASKAVTDTFVPSNSELAEILSLTDKSHLSDAHYQTKIISTEESYLVVPCDDLQQIQAARIDLKAWARSSAPATNASKILLFSEATFLPEANFHLRLLGPNIAEPDPPVGSALTAFSSYLSSFHSLRHGTYTFAVERGTPNTRLSLLHVEMDKKEQNNLTTRIGGPAVLVSKGSLLI